ncbi:bifunctional cystathionine gamma-lyase/homocysteine desulfhydrase [Oceanobacillus indicireducens]|uniref:Cystathionine gamma-lyase n=1 Tax=Oceanobacillus indicireducens TaxID=1004261 RepID=A0A918D2I1_9BACI|nr:bifunctional cystathionine gamma-lyase/homocysteine desulfhydrase [Oceanobacillus indicireducens]GGN60970.1 cystathionine gamma-lyase [Oceanobacillus indicireducens]
MRKKTQLIHSGAAIDKNVGAMSPPIYQASTFKQNGVGNFTYEYSRTGNPTREALETLIADLEKGKRGFAFASGMAAIAAVMDLFQSGDHILITDDVYGGTYRYMTKILNNRNIDVTFTDSSNLGEVKENIRPETKAIFIETPTNPLLKITDIEALADIAKENNLTLIVDNTFNTPYWQSPIEHGANIVIHSATKYLGGHSDLVAGLVVVDDEKLGEAVHFIQNATGGVLAPHDSWLLIRGIRTLGVRMEEIESNTSEIVEFLVNHPQVGNVYYPGLPDHPNREIHAKQSGGFGGMVSFTVDNEEKAMEVLNKVRYFTLAESLGAVESLISLPAKMTHASIPRERRIELGIEDGLIRLSVGLEDVKDLMEDLQQALD